MQVPPNFTSHLKTFVAYCGARSTRPAAEGCAELYKYLFLRATHPASELSPSDEVDELWRWLILGFPRLYANVCSKLGDGKLIDHDPTKADLDAHAVWSVRYSKTRELMQLHSFPAPATWWPAVTEEVTTSSSAKRAREAAEVTPNFTSWIVTKGFNIFIKDFAGQTFKLLVWPRTTVGMIKAEISQKAPNYAIN